MHNCMIISAIFWLASAGVPGWRARMILEGLGTLAMIASLVCWWRER